MITDPFAMSGDNVAKLHAHYRRDQDAIAQIVEILNEPIACTKSELAKIHGETIKRIGEVVEQVRPLA